jgi:leucyl-tRNA synthetase
MELVNDLYAFCDRPGCRFAQRPDGAQVGVLERVETVAVLKEAVEALLLMLSPFAPHMAEELWQRMGHGDGLRSARWPSYDPAVAKAQEIVVPVQVNGKVRARLTVPADASEDEVREQALADPQVQAHIAGKTVQRVFVVPGLKLVSIQVG